MSYIANISNPVIFWAFISFAVCALCMLCAGVLIPQILLISFRKRLFDVPDERKIHQGVVPRLGGIAFKPVIFFSIALMYGICQLLGYNITLREIGVDSRALSFGFCSVMVLYLVGMADDLIGIRYKAKFVVQIACGMMTIAGEMWIDNFHGLFWLHAIPAWIGWPLTLLTVVFIINAVNLIDGIDGLCSGLCGVATLFYGILFFMAHQYFYAVLSFATLGVLVPFFYYNVFGDPEKGKKIFMGDTGSLTVGMLLCILSLKMLQCFPSEESRTMPNIFVLAFSPLVVPCFDVVRVYLRRLRNGKSPFLPDKSHIHHKLLAAGMRQRTAMGVIVGVSMLFTLCNILLSSVVNVTVLLVGDILVWSIANIWLTKKIKVEF